MTKPLSLTVVGAGGLLIGEALRLVEMHPMLELRRAVTRAPGTALLELQPHLACGRDLKTIDLHAATCALREELASDAAQAVLLLGLPHAETAKCWRAMREELGASADRLVVVDLSADYRLRNLEDYTRWYGEHADPGELPNFRYGLPELNGEDLPGATRIAAPGCFATALQLACQPAAAAGILNAEQIWTLNATTGSSGSGVKPREGTHHPFRASNLHAYGLGGHRHEAELVQAIGLSPPLSFLPHSGPFVRGIHLTAVLPLASEIDLEAIQGIYADTYAGQPFVELLPLGEVPDLRRVVGSNRACMALHAKPGALVVLLTLDNILKGGSGQALQALNIALGWPQDLSLPRAGLGVA
ncbi:MAG: N-acetyl-gamma-glutamyl-phosphate reductase common form [Planctomycetota bacterium]